MCLPLILDPTNHDVPELRWLQQSVVYHELRCKIFNNDVPARVRALFQRSPAAWIGRSASLTDGRRRRISDCTIAESPPGWRPDVGRLSLARFLAEVECALFSAFPFEWLHVPRLRACTRLGVARLHEGQVTSSYRLKGERLLKFVSSEQDEVLRSNIGCLERMGNRRSTSWLRT